MTASATPENYTTLTDVTRPISTNRGRGRGFDESVQRIPIMRGGLTELIMGTVQSRERSLQLCSHAEPRRAKLRRVGKELSRSRHENHPVLQSRVSVRCRHGLQMDARMRRLSCRARRERDEWHDGLRQSPLSQPHPHRSQQPSPLLQSSLSSDRFRFRPHQSKSNLLVL
jgi:hypothetical protein